MLDNHDDVDDKFSTQWNDTNDAFSCVYRGLRALHKAYKIGLYIMLHMHCSELRICIAIFTKLQLDMHCDCLGTCYYTHRPIRKF